MKTNCPHCGEEFEVEDSAFGRKANCGACGKDFIIGQVRTEIPNKSFNTTMHEKSSNEKGYVLWVMIFLLLVVIWLGGCAGAFETYSWACTCKLRNEYSKFELDMLGLILGLRFLFTSFFMLWFYRNFLRK